MVHCGLKGPSNHLRLKCFVSLWPPAAPTLNFDSMKTEEPSKKISEVFWDSWEAAGLEDYQMFPVLKSPVTTFPWSPGSDAISITAI